MPPVLKSFALAAVASATLAASAGAADLPRRAPPPVFTPVPVFTWTGFYVGVNAGYGWNNNDVSVTLPSGATFTSDDEGGFVGGAQVGYNYQIGALVLGLEADLQYADLGGEVVIPGFVGFDDGGQRPAFAQRCHITRDPDGPERLHAENCGIGEP